MGKRTILPANTECFWCKGSLANLAIPSKCPHCGTRISAKLENISLKSFFQTLIKNQLIAVIGPASSVKSGLVLICAPDDVKQESGTHFAWDVVYSSSTPGQDNLGIAANYLTPSQIKALKAKSAYVPEPEVKGE